MKRVALGAIAALSTLAALPSPAAAHPPPFWWMADMSGTSRAGFEMSIGNSFAGLSDATPIAGSLFGEFAINPWVALRARLPLTLVFFDPEIAGENSEGAIGNVSLGIQGQASRGNGHTRTMFGGGFELYLPTASNEGVAPAAVDATALLYVPDLSRWLIDVTTARFRGDGRFELGTVFFQGELALDAHFADGDDDFDVVFGFGPGVMASSHLAFLLELTVAEITDDELVTMDVGLRYHDPLLMAGLRFYLPLSDPLRDADVFGVGFDIGARF